MKSNSHCFGGSARRVLFSGAVLMALMAGVAAAHDDDDGVDNALPRVSIATNATFILTIGHAFYFLS